MKRKMNKNATDHMNIREIIYDTFKKYPDNIAYTIKNKGGKPTVATTALDYPENISESYTNIRVSDSVTDIEYIGTAMLTLGLKGKRIAIIGHNRYEWMAAYYASVCGVGMVVPLDKGLPDDEIENSLIISQADCLVFEASYLDSVNEIISRGKTNLSQLICMDEVEGITSISDMLKIGRDEMAAGNDEFLRLPIDNFGPSIMLFTSGTTSQAKAVMLSHRNIASNIYGLTLHEDFYPSDVNMAFLPYHHTFGSTGQLLFFSHGGKTVFCDGIRHIQKNFEEYQVNVFFCVPLINEALYKKILAAAEKKGALKKLRFGQKVSRLLLKFGIDKRDSLFKDVHEGLGTRLRILITGASALNPEVASDLNDWGITSLQGYGLTETSPVLCAEQPWNLVPGSVGKAMPNVEVQIDEPGEDGIGEIIARGPNVMLGYYNNEEDTNHVIKDGWFHTGDLGRLDKDGNLFITGRSKNVIVLKNGKNIYPEEIENNLSNLPYVSELMVFGYEKHNDLAVAAKIVVPESFDPQDEEFRARVWDDIKLQNQDLPTYKHIEYLELTHEPMVKTSTQKVRRQIEIPATMRAGNLEHISQAKK